MAINRYNYLYNNQFINNNQPSILGPNSDNNLLPEDVSAHIQQLLANINVDRKDNTYRVTPPKETVKPLHKQTQFDNGIKEAEDNLTNTLNSINYDTIRDTVDRTKSLFNKPTNSIQQPTTDNNINVPNTVSSTNIPYSLGVNTAFNTGYTPTVNQLSTGLDYNTLGSYNKAMNATITAPKTTGLSSGTPVEGGFDASKATSAVTEGGGSGFNWQAGAGMAAGLAKAAYNKWAPNIYTVGVDDGLEKAAYESIYGDSHQDPLARAATSIFQTNDQRMSNVLGQINSRPLDYSGVRNNDNLINTYQDLSDLKPIEYEGIDKSDYGRFAAPAVAPFIAPFAPVTSTLLSWAPMTAKSKMVQDFNLSTAQGALAGLSYSNGNPWMALAGAGLGSITGIANLIGSKKRTQMYNDAVEKAKRENIESFYNTARRNQDEEIFNSMRMMAEGGSLEELNGVTKFNTGGSHSQNPYNGIQQGIASDNIPNLVEEGELKYNDYIYSARLKPSKSLLKQYNLPEKYAGKTFAEIGDKLQKESEERPNDPVSLQTLNDWMSRLQNAQEEYKAKDEERRLAKVVDNMSDEEKAILLSSLEQPMAQQEDIDLSQPMYAKGGKIHIKPSKRGTFTAAAKKHGKSVQAFASQVLANKENYSPAMVKKANFARNAARWHEDGGHLYPDGGNFEYLRYAPAIGAGLGALYAWTQPKDYEYPNELRGLATEFKPISAPHVGGRLSYTPYDINLGDAENLAMQAAALRTNRVRANRGQEAASAIGLLNTFEKQNALRNLEWQQANEANRKAIAQYNLGIDQFNAQRDSQYDQLNQQILNNRLNMLSNAAQAADVSRTAWANNISSTTENFFNQLGNVGKDEWNRYQFLQWLNQHPATARAWGYEG